MKKVMYCLLAMCLILFSSCSSTKKIETTAPFTLGEVYAQKWITEEEPKTYGYEVVVPIISLHTEKAELKNLYFKGKMAPVTIYLREIGNVAVAEFSKELLESEDTVATTKFSKRKRLKQQKLAENHPFPFDLSETEAVLSYVQKDKVKYMKINGIRQNPAISYDSLRTRNNK